MTRVLPRKWHVHLGFILSPRPRSALDRHTGLENHPADPDSSQSGLRTSLPRNQDKRDRGAAGPLDAARGSGCAEPRGARMPAPKQRPGGTGTTPLMTGIVPDGFVRVDRDYVAQAAELARAGGCKHFVLQSSRGANAQSHFLYLRVKGEVENLVQAVGFDRCTILRPAVLLCRRQESRPMEWIAQQFLGAVARVFPTAYSVPVETVARAMVACVLQPGEGKVKVLENRAIHELGKAVPQQGT
ncbi:PREDICTED: oxidoreductase HTATIP2 [Ficedula albicollis]|uniref:oxidoreductase HTATIP2 n=1 Tax=Ficedula albicollis TaxID=59894 RepID=UPI0007AD8422|nr:PREDICTED: oxidoreductase HTATIP2 [Ficedula albicollis]